jgi:hypothetical protein
LADKAVLGPERAYQNLELLELGASVVYAL